MAAACVTDRWTNRREVIVTDKLYRQQADRERAEADRGRGQTS